MSIEIFSLPLDANETREVDITGSYFELRNAVEQVAAVELLDRSGTVVSKLVNPEQSDYVRTVRPYEKVRITNGPVAQTVRHFYGSGEAGSRRTSGLVKVEGTVKTMGTVEVVDGGKARTAADTAFMGGASRAPTAGQYASVQLKNVSATKRLVVSQITFQASGADGLVLKAGVATLATPVGFLKNKNLLNADSANARIYSDSTAAIPAGVGLNMMQINLSASSTFTFKFTEPINIGPGETLTVCPSTVSNAIGASFEVYEEDDA